MKMAQDTEDPFRTKVAKDFFTAFLANQIGVTFRTAQNYVSDEIGGLWLFLADVAIQTTNENPGLFDNEFKGKIITTTDLEN